MAANSTTFTLRLRTGGMEEAQKQTQIIRDNLEAAAAAAARIGTGTGAAPVGGSPSSRKVASSAAARPTGAGGVAASAAAGGIAGSEVEDYNRARGAAGAAGGTARDFADQARGLGGLVRLYATFAANIFAATAAFNALSQAVDTANMVKGLDQLGASSGRNLGTLSKNLALASDGAISLRDAMEATAKASSAGLSNQQILQLGDAAKKASQALGVNMPDAFSRLSRGISKIEPELLDELGIFVKIDDATTAYARKLGKTASSLTEFERRQAFANAVLEQANQKFSNINIDANPYTKLLASLQNLLQTGLELVNKVLGPIVKYLSESPVALVAVISAIGFTILKQVMPVIGQWREGLRGAANDAAATAEKIKKSFGDEFQSKLEARFRIPDLKNSLKQTESQIDTIASKQSKLGAIPKGLASSATVQSAAADEKSIATIETMLNKRKNYVETGIKDSKKLSDSSLATYRQEAEYLDKKLEKLKQELQLKTLLQRKAEQQAALDIAFKEAQIVADKPVGKYDPEEIATRQYEKALARRDKLSAISNAAENARVLGVRQSWALLNQEVTDKGIKGISKYSTLAQGGMVAVGTRVMGVVGALGNVGMAIGVAIGAWELLSSVASGNKKEAEEASQGFDSLHQSAKFVNEVLSDISKKDPLGKLSLESINARASALNELTTSLEQQFKKITKQVENANWFDILVDGFKTVVGKDLLSTSAKELSYGITQSFKVISEGLGKSEAINKFKEAFKVDPTDQAALNKLLAESPEKFMTIAPKVIAVMKELGIEVNNTASKGKELRDAFDAAEKTLKDFVTSSLPTDPVAKFGVQLVDIGTKLNEALKNPETRLAAIADISKSIAKQSMLGDVGKDIGKQSEEINQALSVLAIYNQALETSINRQQALINKRDTKTGRTTAGLPAEEKSELSRLTEKTIPILKNLTIEPSKVIDKAAAKLTEGAGTAFNNGVKYIEAGIGAAFAKAAITLSSAFAQRLGDTEAGIARRAELEKQSNSLQIAQLVAQKEMLTAQSSVQDAIDRNTTALELSTIATKEANKIALTPQEARRKVEIAAEQKKAEAGTPTENAQQKLLKLAQRNIDAQIAQIRAANKAIDLKTVDQVAERRLKVSNDVLSIETDKLNTAKQLFDIEIKGQPYLTAEQESRKRSLDTQILANKQAQEYSAVQKEIDKNLRTLQDPTSTTKDKTAAIKALEEYGQEANRLVQKQSEERSKADNMYYDSSRENEVKKTEFILEQQKYLQSIEQGILNTKQETASKVRDIEIQTAEQTGKYTQSYLASLKYEAEVSKISEEAKRREVGLTTQYKVEQEQIFQKIAAELQRTGGEGSVLSADLALKMTASTAKYNAEVAGIKATTTAELEKAAAIRKSTEEQDSFNRSLEALKGLESVFPAMGAALSSMVTALKSAVVAQDQYNSSREALNNQIKNEPDQKKKVELTEKLSKLDSERAKDELTNNANLMGSAKKLFKEKTVAYKAFATVEKALHIARIAMEFKELVTSLFVEKGKVAGTVAGEAGQTAATGAGFFARAGLYVTEIFAKISSQLGIFGPPVAAAIVAAIGLSAFGKKSSAPPQGFSDEEQKSVQGTGQTYRDGEKVTRAGALAEDPTARASSVSKSLELVSQNTFENLEYSNKMLNALKNIEKNTKGLTSAMMRSIARTPGGVALPEQIPQGELRGNYIGKGLATAGGAAAGYAVGGLLGTSTLAMGAIGGAVSTLTGGLITAVSGAILPVIGLLFAKPLGKLIGSIFGGQTTQTIETFGIVVKGTLGDIAEGTDGIIQEWANIKNVRKGGWFRKDKTTYSTMEQEAQDPVKEMIRGLFAGVTDALTSAGDVLGKDVSGFLSNYLVKDFKITSKDMKPEELAEAIKGEISIAFNAAAEAAFPEFAEFAQPFEEAGETIIRLARQMQVFDFAMMSIGGTLNATIDTQLAAMTKTETVLKRSEKGWFNFGRMVEVTVTRPLTEAEMKLKKVEIVDSLIEGAGGMEKFQEKVQFFAENFLTEAERLAPVRQAVTDQLQALGLGFIDSRQSFKDYLLAIDLTIPGNVALYNSLMDLAPGIAAIYEASEDARVALSDTELSKKVQDQRIRMLELLGGEANLLEITNIRRKEELAELAKYPKEQADLLIANQKYIYALEDENALKAKIVKVRDQEAQALDKTIKAMQSAIETLKNYRQNLLGGEKSTLTPQQKYQQAQSDFDTLQSIITSSRSTTEEKAAAAGKLPAAADKLLESSRTMFASGEKYAQDFDKVLQAINVSESILSSQQTDSEKQLVKLNESTAFLDAIDKNTKTTTELLQDYLAAQSATAIARSGSATALTIQGSTTGSMQAPVYLDAGQQSPQVITAPTTVAPTTQPVVDVQPLIVKIEELTKEVTALRTDQQQQTAQLIITNDQTTQTAADFIAESNDELMQDRTFKTRAEFSFR